MKYLNSIFALGVCQLLGLVAVIFYLFAPYRSAVELKLHVFPTASTALTPNSYIDLSLPIRHIAVGENPELRKFSRGDLVYALIEPVDSTYRVATISADRPNEGIYLRARVESNGPKYIFLRFGVEQWFISPAQARIIKARPARTRLKAVATVKIGGDGRGVISDLEVL